MNIESLLTEYINNDYKLFHKKICHTKYEILGVKIPILRKISKDLLKKYNYQDIVNNLDLKYYEHIMIYGFIIANVKVSYEEKIKLIDNYLPFIDNWAICDTFISELKFINKYKQEFLEYTLSLLYSDKEYYLRFGIVVLLDYYINDEYIDKVLNKMLEIKSDFYYVKMAISWCLSICLIKHFDKTIDFLTINKNKFDEWTYNKALQKGIESYRISKDNKVLLKSMKL